jgi:hypothetical protein
LVNEGAADLGHWIVRRHKRDSAALVCGGLQLVERQRGRGPSPVGEVGRPEGSAPNSLVDEPD